jgi:hypothetical protein
MWGIIIKNIVSIGNNCFIWLKWNYMSTMCTVVSVNEHYTYLAQHLGLVQSMKRYIDIAEELLDWQHTTITILLNTYHISKYCYIRHPNLNIGLYHSGFQITKQNMYRHFFSAKWNRNIISYFCINYKKTLSNELLHN